MTDEPQKKTPPIQLTPGQHQILGQVATYTERTPRSTEDVRALQRDLARERMKIARVNSDTEIYALYLTMTAAGDGELSHNAFCERVMQNGTHPQRWETLDGRFLGRTKIMGALQRSEELQRAFAAGNQSEVWERLYGVSAANKH